MRQMSPISRRSLAPSRYKLGEFLQEFVELNLHELLRVLVFTQPLDGSATNGVDLLDQLLQGPIEVKLGEKYGRLTELLERRLMELRPLAFELLRHAVPDAHDRRLDTLEHLLPRLLDGARVLALHPLDQMIRHLGGEGEPPARLIVRDRLEREPCAEELRHIIRGRVSDVEPKG